MEQAIARMARGNTSSGQVVLVKMFSLDSMDGSHPDHEQAN